MAVGSEAGAGILVAFTLLGGVENIISCWFIDLNPSKG